MSRRNDALRKLIAAFPPPPSLERAMHGLYEQPDRIAAIMAAAMVEHVLERLLKASFVDRDKVLNGNLFGANGPLASFGSKIQVARAFGVVTEQMAEELGRMKNIRNVFAHASTNVDFSTSEIADEAFGFRMLEAMRSVESVQEAPHAHSFQGKSGFILVAVILSIMMDEAIAKKGGIPVYEREDEKRTPPAKPEG